MPKGRRRRTGGSMLLTSAELIGWALGGLEREIALTRDRLAALNAQAIKLRTRVGGAVRRGREAAAAAGPQGPRGRRRRRRMTPEGRKRLSEMLKKRWAAAKKKNRNRL